MIKTQINKTAVISSYLPEGLIYKKYINNENISPEDKKMVETVITTFTNEEILKLEKLVKKISQDTKYCLQDENNSEILSEVDTHSHNFNIFEDLSEIYKVAKPLFNVLAKNSELFNISEIDFCYQI